MTATPETRPAATNSVDKQDTIRVWVVSDGTAGMRLQSEALASSLCRARPDWQRDDWRITPHRAIRMFPRLAAFMPGLPLYASGISVPADGSLGILDRRPHAGQFPDILITCGRRMAGYALALRRRARAENRRMQCVHIQDPRLSPALFDALIVPEHDRARGDNVLVSKGSLNRLTLTGIHKAMMDLPSRWLTAARVNAVTVMLGGDNRRYAITADMAGSMGERLAALSRDHNLTLMLIPSRRTPDGMVNAIAAALPDDRVLTPRQDEANVYPGVLGLGQAVIVTSDSVNMASEATITGKPVLIAGWRPSTRGNPTGESGRIAAFHGSMMAAGHTAAFTGSIPPGQFPRLDELDSLTTRLLTLLGR